MGRAHGHCSTFFNAQDSSPHQRIIWALASVAQLVECHPMHSVTVGFQVRVHAQIAGSIHSGGVQEAAINISLSSMFFSLPLPSSLSKKSIKTYFFKKRIIWSNTSVVTRLRNPGLQEGKLAVWGIEDVSGVRFGRA